MYLLLNGRQSLTLRKIVKMFTGIIEEVAEVVDVEKQLDNIHIFIKSSLAPQLKIDQSVAHNGVCLTVVDIKNDVHKVTAIAETLNKTNLGFLKKGSKVNLERAALMNARLDGHMVQGHVDLTGKCVKREDKQGSWSFEFEYPVESGHITVGKGSICINGVSLTVVDSLPGKFSVAIIPYTLEHTTFNELQAGDSVNIEFDVIGKYVARYMELMNKK